MVISSVVEYKLRSTFSRIAVGRFDCDDRGEGWRAHHCVSKGKLVAPPSFLALARPLVKGDLFGRAIRVPELSSLGCRLWTYMY